MKSDTHEAGASEGAHSEPRLRLAERAVTVFMLAAYVALLGLGWWVSQRLLPDTLALHIASHTVRIANVHDKLLNNAMVMLLILPGALWLECLMVGWRGSSARQMLVGTTASIRTDMAFFVLSQAHFMDLLAKVMLLGASMISGLWLRDWLQAQLGFAIDPGGLPLALQIAIFFLAYTFFDYWTHRLDHTRYFWPLHRYHHAAHEFCVITAGRAHPAQFAVIFVINVPMAVLGASPEVMIFVNVAQCALGFVIHSRIDSNWGWFGRWVLQSPTHHRLHHKLDMTHPTGHFSMAPIWDHLFGTWYGEADQSLPIGVETPYRHGFWLGPDLARDYWDFWRGLFKRAA
jgi:sterol desaturase/sphingolipid hydroxylase (fatty acid hydroxylase superfamily)